MEDVKFNSALIISHWKRVYYDISFYDNREPFETTNYSGFCIMWGVAVEMHKVHGHRKLRVCNTNASSIKLKPNKEQT